MGLVFENIVDHHLRTAVCEVRALRDNIVAPCRSNAEFYQGIPQKNNR
jgi:hypothetical protein